MNTLSLCRHPAEIDAEAMLSREHAYPDALTLAEHTAERMARARTGLVHVMTVLIPTIEDEQCAILHCWLDNVLVIVDAARIDAEANA